ncbi:MAG: Fe-S cluster assembly protein HesB [Nanoarchaeota archaeon]|nr:Fe-S cluster assembly protein HesB [Nanoarchaeota archaeon]
MVSIPSFQRKVLSFYEKNKRDLPWRRTEDPYKILVSEVMLQQTQVDRVIAYFNRWMGKWPTAKRLSEASKEDVLKAWQGLGYNSRALRLWEASKVLSKEFPKIYDKLIEIKGIGPYTASAVLAFAFNEEIAVVDTNIRRVLIHELGLKEDISLEKLKEIALKCIPKGKSRVWHNALMDYGAMSATARKTKIRSLSKQGKFEGSTRETRAAILRLILEKKEVSMKEIEEKFKHPQIKEILDKMEKEGIVLKGKSIRLA